MLPHAKNTSALRQLKLKSSINLIDIIVIELVFLESKFDFKFGRPPEQLEICTEFEANTLKPL